MREKIFIFVFTILSVFSISSRATNVIVNINAGEITVMGSKMNVPNFGKWYYFSFKTGAIIDSSNFTLKDGAEVPDSLWTTHADWDIAFHATDIRTNGAKAVLIADTTSSTPLANVYAALLKAPTGDYAADEMVSGLCYQSMASMPPPHTTEMSICKATHAWATIARSGNGLNPRVVVFELADGTYVKVYLKDFYNEEGHPGYIDMEYEIFTDEESSIIDINDGTYPDFSKWYYFSFDTGKIVGTSDFTLENSTEVPSAEWAARTDWDIAFHANDIRTNGTKAVLIADTTSSTPLANVYSDLTQAPADGYAADEMVSGAFYLSLSSMPPPYTTEMSICRATHGWATIARSGNGLSPRVVVFELANGKYVKVYLKDFFDEAKKPGYIDMEYAEISAPATSSISNYAKATFNIYPNPATETIHVELVEATTIVIYNLSGAKIKELQAQAGVNSISIDNLSAGIYFIKANNQVEKFIVK